MATPILTVEQMRRLDEFVITRDNAAQKLMGRAGVALADELGTFRNIAVVCGGGNNGGDGYAAIHFLQESNQLDGKNVKIIYTKEPKSDESIHFFKGIHSENVVFEQFSEDTNLEGFDVIVDCLLGTGFGGVPRGSIKEAIELINKTKEENPSVKVISMDINSGVNGDTGTGEIGIVSDITVTIGYKKVGMLKPEFSKWTDEIVAKNIGYQLTPENLGPFDSVTEIVWQ
ncbi:MAG: NAD(P)H-hydrate epimerase [Phoenicibacter congonensis]|uniref:NAD(P)H-hydrate epimerase n=1 Tax=Phoenicibacter congonensis TaxID=1944646 RepID=A0AA43RMG9_9ACTN|nr:NAD(P)H-hydrate epimerase [Phoenicibacter congonensis]